MYINYKDEKIECKVTLRTAMNIQKKNKKPYMQVLKNIDELDMEEQIGILYCGIELGNNKDISFNEFKEYILDNMGLEELSEYIEEFINELQYPGLSEEEIEKKLQEKAKKKKKMEELGLID